MSKSSTINLRVDPDVKEQAGLILQSMGLSFSEAFNLLLHQVRIQRALPFEVTTYSHYPSKETLDLIKGIEDGTEQLVGPFNSKEELRKSLGI